MQAAYLEQTGGPERIEVGRLPVPEPGPTDVLVRVAAAAVNPVDGLVRSGAYRTPITYPFVIGRDLVGTVARATPATGFAPDQPVWCASLGHGGRQGSAAEYAVVAADRLYRLPPGVTDLHTAVATLHPAMTAWLALHRRGRLTAGETVYVGGGAGSVGSALVWFAARAGARVIASARDSDAAWCTERGAEAVLDYRDPARYDALRELVPDGVDVWIETSGHHDLPATVPLLAQGGRIVLLSGLTTHAADAELPVGALYVRDASVVGFAISNASVADLAAAAPAVNHLLAAGPPVVRIGTVLPLSAATRAHRILEGAEPAPGRGRIVLVPGS